MSSDYLHIYLNYFGVTLGFVRLPFYMLFSMITLDLLIYVPYVKKHYPKFVFGIRRL